MLSTNFNGYNGNGANYVYGGISLTWHPATNISLSVGPGYTRYIENAQWVDAFDDPTATATFGKRYVFGKMDQTTMSANIRLDWTFTPKLSLQLYVQPLISAGDFPNSKSLRVPVHTIFLSMEREARPFHSTMEHTQSILTEAERLPHSHLIIRSTIIHRSVEMPSSGGNICLALCSFFVWTQSRSNDQQLGEFEFGPSTEKLWRMMPDNIFMIKMTYYWN